MVSMPDKLAGGGEEACAAVSAALSIATRPYTRSADVQMYDCSETFLFSPKHIVTASSLTLSDSSSLDMIIKGCVFHVFSR